jgi:DNA-binding MarR family transcriptional regulator
VTVWLTTTEDQILASLRRIARCIDLHSRRLTEEIGLTGPQLAVLREANRSRPLCIGELARASHLSQPTVTGILDRLEKRGLVERVRAQHDRRTVNVNATPAGQELLDRAPSLLQDRFRRKLRKLEDWEQTQMLALLQRIASMMEGETPDASVALMTAAADAATEPENAVGTAGEPQAAGE